MANPITININISWAKKFGVKRDSFLDQSAEWTQTNFALASSSPELICECGRNVGELFFFGELSKGGEGEWLFNKKWPMEEKQPILLVLGRFTP